jgi:hypothetical protein
MKGVEISVYSCALVVRNLWLGLARSRPEAPLLIKPNAFEINQGQRANDRETESVSA